MPPAKACEGRPMNLDLPLTWDRSSIFLPWTHTNVRQIHNQFIFAVSSLGWNWKHIRQLCVFYTTRMDIHVAEGDGSLEKSTDRFI